MVSSKENSFIDFLGTQFSQLKFELLKWDYHWLKYTEISDIKIKQIYIKNFGHKSCYRAE